MNKIKKIIILGGDPNSINSEIIIKCWKKISYSIKNRIYIIANTKLIKKQLHFIDRSIKIKTVKSINEKSKKDELKIININLDFKDPFNIVPKHATPYVIKSLELGHKIALNKNSAGLINCAINKNLLLKKNVGVTELLAQKCKIKDKSEVMMIRNKQLAVCPITTHLDLKDVFRSIKKQTIIIKIKTIHKQFIKILKKKPKIAILGLNPHNAELRKKSEEVNEIIPAILDLKKLGYYISGPFSADTIFIKDYKKYDVIVGMYHDQVLGPFKTLFKYNGINITLGLKYLRVSPDHGVAIDLIKKNSADESSLLDCINFINKFS